MLRYGIGQFYKVHADTLRDPEAGVRVATVLVYLVSVLSISGSIYDALSAALSAMVYLCSPICDGLSVAPSLF